MISWIKSHRLEVICLVILLIITAGLRFYRLPEYMTFLGDEGRDALVVREMLVDHRLRLLGPPMSFGNVYLGPLYYYMMAVAMAIVWLNPIAAAGMVAVIGTLTVFLIYYLARNWFGVWSAFLGATLYAISPITIIYSRSSWNPNPAPFFGLLMIVGFFKARQTQNYLWLIVSGIATAAAIQMHYTAVALIMVSLILWLGELTYKSSNRRNFLKGTLLGMGGFLVVMSPLFIFDLNHNFLNFWAIMGIFFDPKSGGVNHNLLNSLARLWPLFEQKFIGRYLAGSNNIVAFISSLLILVPIIWVLFKRFYQKKSVGAWPYLAVGVWMGIGLLSLTFYNQDVYDHYFGSINPAPYLLLAGLIALIPTKARLISFGVILIVLGHFNLTQLPFGPPNNQVLKTEQIAQYIISKSNNQPFNFALISAHNYDAAYQYYLDIYGHTPEVVPLDITQQLWVVCEDPVCQPVTSPKYEIAAFGWTKISEQSEVNGTKIYKLVHNDH